MWGGSEGGGREGDLPWDHPELRDGESRGGGKRIEALQRGQRLPVGYWGWADSGQLRKAFLEEQQQSKSLVVTTGGLHLQDSVRSLG